MKKLWFSCCALILFAAVAYFSNTSFAEMKFFPDPLPKSEVPGYAVWDSTLGMYVSNDLKKDSVSGKYYDPKLLTPDQSIQDQVKDSRVKWFEKHGNSTDVVDMAIVEYEKTLGEKGPSLKSYYDPNEDEALVKLTNLGPKHIKDMLVKIGDPEYSDWAGYLMFAVQKISNSKELPTVDASPSGIAKWTEKAKELKIGE